MRYRIVKHEDPRYSCPFYYVERKFLWWERISSPKTSLSEAENLVKIYQEGVKIRETTIKTYNQ